MNRRTAILRGLDALFILALVAAPFSGAYPLLVMKVLCFALFACAFNLLIGFTGLLSFGHAAFFGGAGYLMGYALTIWNLDPALGLLVGTGFAALLGLAIGGVAIRRQGIYFTMITLALAQMMYFIFLQSPFTHGEDGLQGIPRGRLFGVVDLSNDLVMYYFILLVSALVFFAIGRIVHSPFGQILKAIKENEARAISLGYDVDRFKVLAFALSAAFSGLAGCLKVQVLGFATLTDIHWTMSGLVVLMTLVGGLGTLAGPTVGAVLIVLLEDKLGDAGEWLAELTGLAGFNLLGESVTTVIGLSFVICVLTFRSGLVGELRQRFLPR